MNLKNKVIIVTGASSGMGMELSKQLLEKGAKVAGWSRTRPEIKNNNFFYSQVDLSHPDKVMNAFKNTLDFGNEMIHGLVNNAGYGLFKPMESISVEEWQHIFSVNVHGIFYVTRMVLPVMKKQELGHIVNISSIAGTTGIPEGTAYCGTKWALRGISRALYREVKEDNIKVSCLFPGSINTKFFDGVEGTVANETMLNPVDVASSIVQLMETPDNFNPSEMEIRPMKVKYK